MPKFERDNGGTVKGVKNEKFYRMFLGRDYNNCDGIKIEASPDKVVIKVWKGNECQSVTEINVKDCNQIGWVN